MGEREWVPSQAMKAVAVACQATMDKGAVTVDPAMQVRTPGGAFSVRWDERGSATALG